MPILVLGINLISKCDCFILQQNLNLKHVVFIPKTRLIFKKLNNGMWLTMFLRLPTLLLVNRSSSPRSFCHEVTCPPCKLTWVISTGINKKSHICEIVQIISNSNPSITNQVKTEELKIINSTNPIKIRNQPKDLTRAEAPWGFRSTIWSIPFLSFVTSIAALGSQAAACPIP